MLREQAERFVSELLAAYTETPTRRETQDIYARYLSELRYESVEQVLPDLIRTSSRLPTIADIRRRIAEVELGLPTPLEAYHSIFERGAGRHPLARCVADLFRGGY